MMGDKIEMMISIEVVVEFYDRDDVELNDQFATKVQDYYADRLVGQSHWIGGEKVHVIGMG